MGPSLGSADLLFEGLGELDLLAREEPSPSGSGSSSGSSLREEKKTLLAEQEVARRRGLHAVLAKERPHAVLDHRAHYSHQEHPLPRHPLFGPRLLGGGVVGLGDEVRTR
jgi:hypothetical protein